MARFFLALLFLLVSSSLYADLKTASFLELSSWGFKPLSLVQNSLDLFYFEYPQNSLPFPVMLKEDNDPFGRTMQQFQDHTEPAYYHAGLDIRVSEGDAVTTPVSGRIEGGYYAYTDSYDGSTQKHFLPLKDALEGHGAPLWGEYYFEVAVIDVYGHRFEFHHINPNTLPSTLKNKILNGGHVIAGDFVGDVIKTTSKPLGMEYHHLHYNIVSAKGLYINPLYVSESVGDELPPHIESVYVATKSSCGTDWPFLQEVADGAAAQQGDYLVVEAFDKIRDGKFVFPPTIVRAIFESTASVFEWNFTKALVTKEGVLPQMTELYLKNYCATFGESGLSTTLKKSSGNYNFFIKIPMPKNYKGVVQIEVEDIGGNKAHRQFTISNF